MANNHDWLDRGSAVAEPEFPRTTAPQPADWLVKGLRIDHTRSKAAKDPVGGFMPAIRRTGGQMLTTAATTAEDVIGPNAATRAVREAGEGIIERNPTQITSVAEAIKHPWTTVKESVGQFVPQIGAAAAGGFTGARAGAVIGGALGGPAGAALGGTIGGAAGGLAPIFVQEYGGIRQDQQESGIDDKARASPLQCRPRLWSVLAWAAPCAS